MGNDLFGGCCKEQSNYFGTSHTEVSKLSHEDYNDRPRNEIKQKISSKSIDCLQSLPICAKNVIFSIKESPFIFYDMLAMIGTGAYGKVYKVRDKCNGLIRAMKVISKKQFQDMYTEEEIENEINVLKNTSHPNIMKLFETFSDQENYYMINEYCSDGEMTQLVLSLRKLPESVVKYFMYKVFTAVTYLHSNNIIHGDIKLENIMLENTKQKTNDELKEEAEDVYKKKWEYITSGIPEEVYDKLKSYDIKLIDFGCSKLFKGNHGQFKDKIGTVSTVAPEVLNKNYNEKCDIWSCGVVMYILLSGELPFNGVTENEIQQKIIRGRFCFYNRLFKDISFEAKDLIRKCFVYSPSSRISAKEALSHPFFKVGLPNELISEDYCQIKSRQIMSSLVSFSEKSKFFQAVLTYLTHNFIKKEDNEQLKSVFLSIDDDHDGKISRQELQNCLNNIGLQKNDEEIDLIMKRVDFDNDGFIDYSEFLQSTINLKELFTEENLRKAFRLFDTHSDGTVSVRELEEILGLTKTKNHKIIDELLKDIKKTEYDEFTFEEFKMFLLEYIEDHSSKPISTNVSAGASTNISSD